MINTISLTDFITEDCEFVKVPFYYNNEKIDSAFWGMTLLKAGSMRFRWNEINENRKKLSSFFENKIISPIELIHSKIVVESKSENDTNNIQADGIVTQNSNIVPTVTVADCVPLFLFDTKTKAFGVFHSGWKGTGIVGEGVKKMSELYGSYPENICAAIGPHIGDCCYFVDEERAEYFTKNFGENCISKSNDKFQLSLTNANLYVLKNAGILEENIVISKDCTCCTTFKNGKNIFGSFRREAAFLDLPNEEKSRKMTVQSAFCVVN